MKNKLLLTAVALALASAVYAAQPRTVAIPHVSPEKFQNLIVEPRADCTFDFPALAAANAASAVGQQCAESWDCATTGGTVSVGDACLAASNLGADGGAALSAQASLRCRAKSSAVVFQLCWAGNDAGTYDLGDAGFTARIIH